MFTILHNRADGTQEMFQAATIQHIPPTEHAGDSAGLHLLGEEAPGVRIGTLRDGTVFVMNGQGATVGRFYLGLPPPPPNRDPNEGKPAVCRGYSGFEPKLSGMGQTP